jgi:hypothetical protein
VNAANSAAAGVPVDSRCKVTGFNCHADCPHPCRVDGVQGTHSQEFNCPACGAAGVVHITAAAGVPPDQKGGA